MSSMTAYLQKKLLDHSLGIASYTMPTTVYLSLHTSDPGETGSLSGEITTSGSAYARISLATKMNATDSSTGVSENNTTITFGPATTDWGTVTHVAISDASTAGNMLMKGPLSTAQTATIGQSIQFTSGQLSATFA